MQMGHRCLLKFLTFVLCHYISQCFGHIPTSDRDICTTFHSIIIILVLVDKCGLTCLDFGKSIWLSRSLNWVSRSNEYYARHGMGDLNMIMRGISVVNGP